MGHSSQLLKYTTSLMFQPQRFAFGPDYAWRVLPKLRKKIDGRDEGGGCLLYTSDAADES